MHELDDFDRALLQHLQLNNRLTSEQLSERIGLSPAACQKRLKKLRQGGVIEAEVAVLNPRAVGYPMSIIVEVSLERETLAVLEAFKRRMRECPEVMQCFYVTGESDFILLLSVRDIEDYERFTREHFFDNAELRKFKTHIVMDRVKVGLSLPIAER